MPSRTALALAVAVWTLLTWGGRIRLLTEAEQDPSNWIRIGGSLLIGAAAVVVLLVAADSGVERWVLTLFAVWSTVIWVRSLIAVWGGDESLAFRAVHTVLALGFLILAYLTIRVGWQR